MQASGAAVGQEVGVGTAGVFEGVGQGGQAVEGTVGVEGPGEAGDGAVVPGESGVIDGDGAEGIAEYVAEEETMLLHLLVVG